MLKESSTVSFRLEFRRNCPMQNHKKLDPQQKREDFKNLAWKRGGSLLAFPQRAFSRLQPPPKKYFKTRGVIW
jgi:hypothetical protein